MTDHKQELKKLIHAGHSDSAKEYLDAHKEHFPNHAELSKHVDDMRAYSRKVYASSNKAKMDAAVKGFNKAHEKAKSVLGENMTTKKTLAQLKEATGHLVKGILGPSEMRELKQFLFQLSSAFRSDIPHLLSQIENKLNFFGYTLDVDADAEFDDLEGSERFYILTVADKTPVKNAYIDLEWSKLASGQQSEFVPDGAALRYDVSVSIFEIAPSEFEDMMRNTLLDFGNNADELFGSQDVISRNTDINPEDADLEPQTFVPDEEHVYHGDYDDQPEGVWTNEEVLDETIDYKTADEHRGLINMHMKQLEKYKKDPVVASFHASQVVYHANALAGHHRSRADLHLGEEALNEVVYRTKTINRTLTAFVDKKQLNCTVNTNGNLTLGIDGQTLNIPRQRAPQFMQSLMDHYLKYGPHNHSDDEVSESLDESLNVWGNHSTHTNGKWKLLNPNHPDPLKMADHWEGKGYQTKLLPDGKRP